MKPVEGREGPSFSLAIEAGFCQSFRYVEGAVRLGDARTVNSVKRGARPQGRSEVRFLTFPPTARPFEFLIKIEATNPEIAGRQCL